MRNDAGTPPPASRVRRGTGELPRGSHRIVTRPGAGTQRLADPGLSPEGIAAAHRISRRYLYKLLAEQGHTVSGWIREQRLARCRRDLADPALDHLPVGAIGGRWGFADPAHFSHAFKAAYGLSPREARAAGR
ncbi:helix-turn-helix domain-containing protein [Streptomyces sp. NPDC020298]|uniref:helix-turn-helix domain-containing protein n=1 Tax=unclassified Streptomyces TaxID=2593676 RepID=UPI0033CEC624